MSRNKMIDLCLSGVLFFQALKHVKTRIQPRAPHPAGGAYDALPDPLVSWGWGHPLPIPFPLDASGISISAPRLSGPRLV